MAGIFINYRREDSGGYAGRLYEVLTATFGREFVFIDIDTIAPGEDFPTALREQLSRCNVFLAVVGRNWLRITDEDGRRRLEDPQDFVRQEIVAALGQPIRIIPVLVGGAHMPAAYELPAEIRPFAFRNAYEIPDRFVHESVNGLVEELRSDLPVFRMPFRWSRRSVFIATSGAVATVVGSIKLLDVRLSGTAGTTAVEDGTGSNAPKLELPEDKASPVRIRAPQTVSELPPAVDGSAPAGLLTSEVDGPRKPRISWATHVTIGHTWWLVGTAPDGTLYLWDDEYRRVCGVRNGVEQWAYDELERVEGLAPDGSIWLSRGQRLCCFNSKGDGGYLPDATRLPSDLMSAAKSAEPLGYRCTNGVLQSEKPHWIVELDGNCASDDVVRDAGGNVYAASDRGTLFCVSPIGSLLWKYSAKIPLRGPIVAGGDLILGEEVGLVCLRDGRLRWTLPLSGAVPALADKTGTVYVLYFARPKGTAISEYHIGAVSAEGKLLWEFRTGHTRFSPVGLDPHGHLYLVDTENRRLVCLTD